MGMTTHEMLAHRLERKQRNIERLERKIKDLEKRIKQMDWERETDYRYDIS